MQKCMISSQCMGGFRVGSHNGFWCGIAHGNSASKSDFITYAFRSFEWEINGVVHIVNYATEKKVTGHFFDVDPASDSQDMD